MCTIGHVLRPGRIGERVGSCVFLLPVLLFEGSLKFRAHHLAHTCYDIVLLGQVNEAHTLRGTTHHTHLSHTQTNGYAALVDDHEVVVVGNVLDGHQSTGLFGYGEGLHTFTTTVCGTIVLHLRTLAIAVFAHHHDRFPLGIVHHNHTYHSIIVAIQTHASHTRCHTSHIAHGTFMEPYGTPVAVGQNQFVVAIGEAYVNHFVAIHNIDGIHAIGSWATIGFQARFLYRTVLGGKHHIVGFDEVFVFESSSSQPQEGIHGIVSINIQQVLYGTSLRSLVAFRNFIALQPMATSFLGKEQHGLVHRGGIDKLGEILVACMGTLRPYSASGLLAEVAQWRALDVTQMAYRNNYRIVGVEVFRVELMLGRNNLRATCIAILLLHLLQFVFHHLFAQFRIFENTVQIGYLAFQLLIFGMQLLQAQTCELGEAHIDNSFRLQIVEVKTLFQVGLCFGRCFAGTNDMHHLVDIVAGYDETFQDMGTFFGFTQVETCATKGYIMTMLHEILHTLFQREQLRATFHQSDAIHRE